MTTIGQQATLETMTIQDQPLLRADVYLPSGVPRAVIIFYYGGSWQSGKRRWYGFVGRSLAEHGYVVVIPDYRKAPEVTFPVFITDSALAVRWTISMRQRWGSPPLFLSGHSAGAHIALLLATDARYLAAEGVQLAQIKGVIGIAGPYDFLPMTDPKIIAAFGGDRWLAASQPIQFAGRETPPLLLLHGDADRLVLKRNSERLAAKVQDAGGKAEVHIYSGLGHIGALLAFARGIAHRAPVLEDMTTWIEQQLAAPEQPLG